MSVRTDIDDLNTTLIQYSGDWKAISGSTRQWKGGVHVTAQEGASATFGFRGYQIWVWGTIPAGAGTNVVEFSIDGSSPEVTTHESNGSAIFNVLYYTSPLLRDADHYILITNRGSSAAGNAEFHLDRFEFEGSTEQPIFPTITRSTVSSATAPVVSSHSPTRSSKPPIGAILGAVIGALALVVGVLLFYLWRSRKGRTAAEDSVRSPKRVLFWRHRTAVTPFQGGQPAFVTPPVIQTQPSDATEASSLSTTTRTDGSSSEKLRRHQNQLPNIHSQTDLISTNSGGRPTSPSIASHHPASNDLQPIRNMQSFESSASSRPTHNIDNSVYLTDTPDVPPPYVQT